MDYMPEHCPADFTVEQSCWMRLTYWAQRQRRVPFATIQDQKEAVRAGLLPPCQGFYVHGTVLIFNLQHLS